MPRILSTALLIEKNRLASDHVWTCLFQLDIVGAPAPFRLAAYDQDLVFHGLTYFRYSLDVDALEEPTHAALVQLNVRVGNVDQQLIALLENYWATQASPDWQATVWTIDVRQPDETPFGAGEVFTVQHAVTDLVTATFSLVAEGLTLSASLPKRRFTASSGFTSIPLRN
jgi:hypothetical protein